MAYNRSHLQSWGTIKSSWLAYNGTDDNNDYGTDDTEGTVEADQDQSIQQLKFPFSAPALVDYQCLKVWHFATDLWDSSESVASRNLNIAMCIPLSLSLFLYTHTHPRTHTHTLIQIHATTRTNKHTCTHNIRKNVRTYTHKHHWKSNWQFQVA